MRSLLLLYHVQSDTASLSAASRRSTSIHVLSSPSINLSAAAKMHMLVMRLSAEMSSILRMACVVRVVTSSSCTQGREVRAAVCIVLVLTLTGALIASDTMSAKSRVMTVKRFMLWVCACVIVGMCALERDVRSEVVWIVVVGFSMSTGTSYLCLKRANSLRFRRVTLAYAGAWWKNVREYASFISESQQCSYAKRNKNFVEQP